MEHPHQELFAAVEDIFNDEAIDELLADEQMARNRRMANDLGQLKHPVLKALAVLHSPQVIAVIPLDGSPSKEYWVCTDCIQMLHCDEDDCECDGAGGAAGYAEWPCRTSIMLHQGIKKDPLGGAL